MKKREVFATLENSVFPQLPTTLYTKIATIKIFALHSIKVHCGFITRKCNYKYYLELFLRKVPDL